MCINEFNNCSAENTSRTNSKYQVPTNALFKERTKKERGIEKKREGDLMKNVSDVK